MKKYLIVMVSLILTVSSAMAIDTAIPGGFSGLLARYYVAGPLQSVYIYSEGRRHGPYWNYDVQNHLTEHGFYFEDGQNGMVTTYYENGEVMREKVFSLGNPDGVSEYFSPEGLRLVQVRYKDGKMDGPIRYFDKQGRLRAAVDASSVNSH